MPDRTHSMTLRYPAARWQDALPTGNGTVGALVYGHVRTETILLNHEALWLRTPKPAIPDVSRHLPELRKLLAEGKYTEAELSLDAKLKEGGYAFRGVDPYHPAFDLRIETDTRGAFSHYRRRVDFETGEVNVTWLDGDVRFDRQLFVSRADDVVVLRTLGSSPGSVTCGLGLRQHSTSEFAADTNPRDRVLPSYTASADGEWLTIVGRYEGGGEFGGVARVIVSGGDYAARDGMIRVAGADDVLLVMKLFAPAFGEGARRGAPLQEEREGARGGAPLLDEIGSLPGDYDSLLARHAPLHRELFSRMKLDLGAGEERSLSNEEILLTAYDGEVSSALIERMADFGRYALICSSRMGGLPANLQGVWNGKYAPEWASDYHNDENIQMNYWQALPGNMPEVTLPYFTYYESMLDDNRANARALYGARGIYAPISQGTHGMAYPDVWLNWTAGAGWLAQLFFDYWLFTGDRKFLVSRAVPFLTEVALFYEDFLIEDENGRYLFSPSLSPENVPGPQGNHMVALNATMDVAVAREVLANLCEACQTLGIESDGVRRWRAMLGKLPEYEINADGALREWLHPDLLDNYHHRHQSHIYPVFPGLEVTEESHPKLYNAAKVALQKRLVLGLNSQTGWSFAHMANAWARLGEGDRALECLELLCRSCIGPNLFTTHNDWRYMGVTMASWGERVPPFQFDANSGFPAAVLEMLVFSKPGMIKLLPALPTKWVKGKVSGVLCRGGVIVSMEWDMTQGRISAVLLSKTSQTVTVKLPRDVKSIETEASVSESEHGPAYRVITLPAGEKVTFTVTVQR